MCLAFALYHTCPSVYDALAVNLGASSVTHVTFAVDPFDDQTADLDNNPRFDLALDLIADIEARLNDELDP